MLTPAQIQAILAIANIFTLNNASAPYNTISTKDISNWAGLGLNYGTGDRAKLIIRIVSPIGTLPPVYQNAGWNANPALSSFAAPDLEFNVTTQTGNKTLPVITATNDAIPGDYIVQVQYSVVQGGNPAVVGQMNFQSDLDTSHLIRSPKISANYSCTTSPTTFTATDDTNLADDIYTFVSISRTITITPPVASGQGPQTGNAGSLTIPNLWAPAPYQYKVVGVVTYSLGADQFIINYATNSYTDVSCDDVLCKIYCYLKKVRANFYAETNTSKKQRYLDTLFLGQMEYNMIVDARICGDQTSVQNYVAQFMSNNPDFDPKCNCCDDFGPAPVIAIGGAGPAGPQGPTGPAGVAGPAGPTGAAGANGSNGTNGTNGLGLIWSDATDSTSATTGSLTNLKTKSTDHTNTAKTLVNVGDTLVITASLIATIAGACPVVIIMNGTGASNFNLWYANLPMPAVIPADNNNPTTLFSRAKITVVVTLTDSTSAAMKIRYDAELVFYTQFGTSYKWNSQWAPIGDKTGLDFAASNYTFSIAVNQSSANDVICKDFKCLKESV